MNSKHPGGRPLKFNSNKELQELIDEYFEECDLKGEYYTITGLADYLDTDRITLVRYENRDEFSNTIKKAKRKVEKQFIQNSLNGKYLTGQEKIDVPKTRREGNGLYLEVKGAKEHNLKNINVFVKNSSNK